MVAGMSRVAGCWSHRSLDCAVTIAAVAITASPAGLELRRLGGGGETRSPASAGSGAR